jgi:Tol biopolymer transport system component
MDRAGKRAAGATAPRLADTFAMSADGRRLAFAIRPPLISNESDVWIQDLPAGTPSKFTFGPKPGWRSPVWSPDASQIAYASLNEAGLSSYELRRKRADMTGGEETLAKIDSVIYLWDWAPDGTSLVYSVRGDLWQLPLAGARTPIQLTSTPAEDQYGQISPDGRWLAYAGGDRAGMQVFVQPLPATGALWLISGDGASQPRWRHDGKELFFRAADGRLMAAPVLTTAGSTSFQHGTPQPLFGPIHEVGTVPRYMYQPSADGQRFFLALPVQSGAKPITMILNWTAGLKK